jgi:hypothetical protein
MTSGTASRQLVEQPLHALQVERVVDLDRGAAGDGRGHVVADVGERRLAHFAIGDLENLGRPRAPPPRPTHRRVRCFHGDRARAERLDLEADRFKSAAMRLAFDLLETVVRSSRIGYEADFCRPLATRQLHGTPSRKECARGDGADR